VTVIRHVEPQTLEAQLLRINHVTLCVMLGTHYPCSWVSNTAVISDTRFYAPCSRAPVYTTREHGPSTRPVNTECVPSLN